MMRKFLPIISVINSIILGVSFFIGLTISYKYYEGNRIIGYSICFGLATILIIIIDLISYLIIKKIQIKTVNKSNVFSIKNKFRNNRVQKFIVLFLIVIIIIFMVLIMLGLCRIIKLNAFVLFILAISSFILSCVGFIVAFHNKK